jgi:hypothetical protein
MPKYFEGNKKLPYAKELLSLEQLTTRKLGELLDKHRDALSLCVRFPSFEQDCLGYVFNIKRTDGKYELSDITGKKLLVIEAGDALISMIQHVSGAKYDTDWQKTFQQLRNQITSSK